MTGPGAHSAGSRGTDRLLRYAALAAGVVAAAVIAVASDDPRWLRLGVLAALWAALLAAFAVVRLRRDSADGAKRAEEMRAVYRLELEREVLARREHELTVEREIRTKVEAQGRHELDAVRAELRTLRETLSQLLGGEVLVEQVALRAQSTRVRSLGESSQQPAAARALGLGREPAQRQVPPDGVREARPVAPVRPNFPRVTPVRAPEPVLPEQPAARRPRPQDPTPLEPAAQLPDDTVSGEPSNTRGTSWQADSTGPSPPEPHAGPEGRHHQTRRPTAVTPHTSAERNGSGTRRAPDVPGSPRSVDDFLAAYGAKPGPGRHHRHRRREDHP